MSSIKTVLTVLLLALAAQGAEAPSKGVYASSRSSLGMSTPKTLTAVAAVGDGPVLVGTPLNSGVPTQFNLPAVTGGTAFFGDLGFTIFVPQGAQRLEVRLVTNTAGADVDLYLRFGTDITVVNGNVVADKYSQGPAGSEFITVNPCTPIQAGTYYIGLGLFTNGVPVNGTITATIDANTVPTCPLLNSGIPASFSFPAVNNGTLFRDDNSFRIAVPAGATQLVIQLVTTTANANVDLYVRLGADVNFSGGAVVANYSSTGPTGNETITVTPSSSPPLQGGTYFVALGVLTTGTPVSGNVTATVGGGGGGGGGGANITGIKYEGGSLSGATFSGNGQTWTAIPDGFFVLGVSLQGVGNPLLNAANKSVNIAPGTYFTYNEPTSFGTALRVTINWSGGRADDVAIFSPGAFSPATAWSRLQGSTNISLSSTGFLTTDKVGSGIGPNGVNDNVLQLTVGGAGGGGGGGACIPPAGGSGGYTLNRIEVTRSYAGAQPVIDTGIQRGLTTLGPTQCSFPFGWNFNWPDASTGPNHNTANAMVNLTQSPLNVTPATAAAFAAGMTGHWDTTGYGVERDHTISLSGAAGTNQASVVGSPSSIRDLQFTTSASSSVPSPDGSGEIALTLNASVRFGDDHTGTMAVRLVYRGAGGGGCTYSINPTSQSVAAGGGSGSVSVTAGSGCAWSAISNANFITITFGASGSGNGTVSYSVAANTSASSRTGTLTIAGQTFTVNQSGQAGGGGANITGIRYDGGSLSGTTFSSNGQTWTAIPDGFFVLGVSLPGVGNPLLNAANKSVNIAPGTYYTYNEPTSFGTALRVTINWSDGRPDDVAVFSPGAFSPATSWTRLQGSTNISLASTGFLTTDKVGGGIGPNGTNDNVLQLTVGGAGGGGGGGGGEAYWRFDEGSGTLASDATGNGNTGTLLNGAGWAAGIKGTALSLDGVNAYVDIGNKLKIESSNFTLEAWIRGDPSMEQYGRILDSGYLSGFALGGSSDKRQVLFEFMGSQRLSSSALVIDNTWHHVAVVKSGPTATLYTDAVAQGSVPVNPGAPTNSLPLFIGYNPGEGTRGHWKGQIDEAHIYSRALSAAEVLASYNATMGGGGGGCTYAINPTSQSIAASGGSGSVSVTSGAGCSWSATSNANFITITFGASGSGNGTVNYTVAANTSASSRTGTLTIAGQTFTVTQAGQGGCTYSINPTSQSFNADGGNGSVSVTSGAGCSWTASTNSNFINVTFGSSGSGNGTVNYAVAPNTSTSSRTGTLTIAGQTFTVTQSGQGGGGGAPITSSVNSLTFSATAGSNPQPQTFNVRATVNYGIITDQTWLAVSPTSGAPSGSGITHTATVNTSGLGGGNYTGHIVITASGSPALSPEGQDPSQAFSISITVTLTITAAPGATPVISAVVNAASYANPSLPNGAISKGAIFTVFGAAVGPSTLASVSSFPLQPSLAGVSIKISKGGTSVDAIPLAVVGTQINAVMPSNAPTGQVQIIVTVNGRASAPFTIQVVESNFAMFTANQSGMGPGIFTNFVSQSEQPVNSPNRTAKPSQFVTAWGTGLGGINGADNQPPPAGNLPVTVEITVGGKRVTNIQYNGRAPCCSGLDQIVFQIPPDAPQGCYVPVIIRVNSIAANATTMAIDPQGAACSDPGNPFTRFAINGGKLGAVELIRVAARLQLDPTTNFTNINLDLGLAEFAEITAGGEFSYNPLTSLPPAGSCTVVSGGGIDVSNLLGGSLPSLPGGAKILNAGAALSVTGTRGTQPIPRNTDANGLYLNIIGGSLPLPGLPNLPPLLDPGTFTVRGTGGPDVGPFTLNMTVPSPITWTNQQQLATVDRSQGATLTWTGGDASSQGILILGGNLDNKSEAGALFACLAPINAGSFTVPGSITSALPQSNLQSPSDSIGFLLIGAAPSGNAPTFTASGIDLGVGLFFQFVATSTVYR